MTREIPPPIFVDDEPHAQPERGTPPPTHAIPPHIAAMPLPARAVAPRTPCPPPGVYTNRTFEEYIAWDAENHSVARHIERSEAHYRAARDQNGGKETSSKAFGTGEHALLFEPERFSAMLVPPPINPSTRKPYWRNTQAWADYAAQHPGKLILTDDEIANMRAGVRQLMSHPDAAEVLLADGMSEVAVVWDEQTEHGPLRCKSRIDRLIRCPIISKRYGWADLKTTESADHAEWRRSMIRYGYHTQAAWIDRGLAANNLPTGGLFLVVESSDPWEPAVFEIGEETMRVARAMVQEWIWRIARCQKTGEYLGYHRGVQVIDAPEYYFHSRAGGD